METEPDERLSLPPHFTSASSCQTGVSLLSTYRALDKAHSSPYRRIIRRRGSFTRASTSFDRCSRCESREEVQVR